MKREIIHPKGLFWSKNVEGRKEEKGRWEKITDPDVIKALKELSAQLKAEAIIKNPT